MIRLASLFWLALVAVTGFATFKVKYTVQDIEDELNKARRHTIAEQQEIHILRAEWTALNQPERLAELNRRFLSLAAVAPKQMQRKIEDIALPPLNSATSARRSTTTRKTTANKAAVATSRVRQVSSTWLARSSATTGAQGGGGLKWRGRQGLSSRRGAVVISGSRQFRRSAGRASAA